MSKIEWTNITWNPITGCNKKSEGCLNCYAEKMHKRLKAMRQEKYKYPFECILFHYKELSRDLGKKSKLVFVNSMSDTFNEKITDEQIDKILDYCKNQYRHEFQILTKRAERLPDFIYPENVWLGVTVEKTNYKNRIEYLKNTNAKIKFLSCEPLLGDLGELDLRGIDWVIAGGETGFNARPVHPDWIRNIQKQCQKARVPFFFKQWGEWIPASQTKNSILEKRCQILLKNGDLINGIFPADVKKFEKENYKIDDCNGVIVGKIGKTKAGALLDGVEYKEFPNYIVQFGEMEDL